MLSTKSKKKLLKKSRLYVIVDKKISVGRSVSGIAYKLEQAGVDIIQLRDKCPNRQNFLKEAAALSGLLLDTKTIFIINDYLDIAKLTNSDGVHLGQDDVPIEIARRILGDDKIIGISCHSLTQATKAQNAGADYISIGPIFPTSTKPEYKPVGLDLVRRCKRKIKIPFFAIGDINPNNLPGVVSAGAKRIAVCRAICQSKNIPLAVKNLAKKL